MHPTWLYRLHVTGTASFLPHCFYIGYISLSMACTLSCKYRLVMTRLLHSSFIPLVQQQISQQEIATKSRHASPALDFEILDVHIRKHKGLWWSIGSKPAGLCFVYQPRLHMTIEIALDEWWTCRNFGRCQRLNIPNHCLRLLIFQIRLHMHQN